MQQSFVATSLFCSWRNFGWVLLYVHRNHRLIRGGIPGRPPRLSNSSWALLLKKLKACVFMSSVVCLVTNTKRIRDVRQTIFYDWIDNVGCVCVGGGGGERRCVHIYISFWSHCTVHANAAHTQTHTHTHTHTHTATKQRFLMMKNNSSKKTA